MMRFPLLILPLLLQAAPDDALPGTKPLTETRDLADRMMDGLHQYADRKLAESLQTRERFWKRDPSSREAYEKSVAPNRKRFLEIIGVVDPRLPPRIEKFGDDVNPALAAEAPRFKVWQVRWPVLDGVTGEGLLLEPAGKVAGHAVVLPDADQTPEQLSGLAPGVPPEQQTAHRLADHGFRVLVPTILSRDFEGSGHEGVGWTTQTHREWIYRQAFHMGRHVIGYEVQKVLAAVDAIKAAFPNAKVGVAGSGEGGLLALYSAAADPRIDAALVSGYFGPREGAWKEPLYRNIWSLLREFGDAELGALVAPRALVVDARPAPAPAPGPAKTPPGRKPGPAVGALQSPTTDEATGEFKRLAGLLPAGFQPRRFVADGDALPAFAGFLGVASELPLTADPVIERRGRLDVGDRQRRQVRELEAHVQTLIRDGNRTREAYFLGTTSLMKGLESRGDRFRMASVKTRPAETFEKEAAPFRDRFWDEVIGRLEDPLADPNPRSRRIYDRPAWAGYDVVLDVAPEYTAWGVLLLPKDLKAGERRPVVVCQHGRNGLPKDTIEGNTWAYHDFAAKLAERGFIVFSPHNPYRGEDKYRLLSRKANLVKGSLFSFILQQHRQILAWLKSLPQVDPSRIAFYGLSYGGETAIRVPPLLTDYCLSICSGDFNDWAKKVASTDSDYSFMYSIEWEMPYFNMGSTFNYAELSYLMVPRPFMVERGHHDGVAPDEWVSSEYAKTRWVYAQLGLADRTTIEFTNGGHTIYGAGTFDFLHRHLDWPKQEGRK
jgi:dienelactone hydrolase